MGISNHSEDSSAAFGMGNFADDQALAVGNANTVANGGGAIGGYNTLYATGSIALGSFNEANQNDGDGFGNILIGSSNIAGAIASNSYTEQCILIGLENDAMGERNFVFGEGNIGQYQTVTVGTYAEPVNNASLIVGIGTGKATGERENGLVVMKNGDVVLPKPQGDISMGAYQ